MKDGGPYTLSGDHSVTVLLGNAYFVEEEGEQSAFDVILIHASPTIGEKPFYHLTFLGIIDGSLGGTNVLPFQDGPGDQRMYLSRRGKRAILTFCLIRDGAWEEVSWLNVRFAPDNLVTPWQKRAASNGPRPPLLPFCARV